ncbi:hypothetical protein [Veronia nyctiphanis]|uniref:hypothetical protein n=1 Tax=Veronia nyctiphanis TaxID=1278244 RepID=UPI00100B6714|nr:hypothetical protein [Veronia nyctiphanis]
MFKPTRVRKGAIAYLQSGILVMLPIITLFVAVWGYSFATTVPKLDRAKLDEEVPCKVHLESATTVSVLN